jgi:NADP-reducing hydrogenase subunit HndB
MSAIKSLEELKRFREQALEKQRVKSVSGAAQVIVGMGTCGIAAGARETMKSILEYIQTNNVSDVTVTQTGCIGLCEKEPIVMVEVGDGPRVTYGKVTPEVAERIIHEHVVFGKPVRDHVIEA